MGGAEGPRRLTRGPGKRPPWHMLRHMPASRDRRADLTNHARKVSLFRNGRSQAIRIPKEFELPGKEATITKDGDRLIIEPGSKKSLLEMLDILEPLEEDFPEIKDLPAEPVDLD